MKIRFLFLAAILFATLACQAEILIYRGIANALYIGAGANQTVRVRTYFVYDTQTEAATSIGYFTLNRQKNYVAVALENHRLVTVEGARGKSYTVIAKADDSDRTLSDGSTTHLQAGWSRGQNAPLKTGSQSVAFFPRTFVEVDRVIASAEGHLMAAEGRGSMVYWQKETIAANDRGDTDEQVVARLRSQLEATGFVDITPTPVTP